MLFTKATSLTLAKLQGFEDVNWNIAAYPFDDFSSFVPIYIRKPVLLRNSAKIFLNPNFYLWYEVSFDIPDIS